jgi:hypothetical protein
MPMTCTTSSRPQIYQTSGMPDANAVGTLPVGPSSGGCAS